MTVTRSLYSIKKEAREVLLQLYSLYYEENGQYLAPDDFFPVDINKIISSVMHWQCERVADIGCDPAGQRLRGHCDYDNKRISIASDGIRPEEQVFTLAHEIGHALLHANEAGTAAGSARKRSIRRVESATSTEREKKREREANLFASELLMPEKAVRDYFFRIFGRKDIWVGSSKAQKVITGGNPHPSRFTGTIRNAAEASPYFADYREVETGSSLREIFGVSRAAMSVRLLELKLLF